MQGKQEEYRGYTITPIHDKDKTGYNITSPHFPNVVVYRYTKKQCYCFIDGIHRKECLFEACSFEEFTK